MYWTTAYDNNIAYASWVFCIHTPILLIVWFQVLYLSKHTVKAPATMKCMYFDSFLLYMSSFSDMFHSMSQQSFCPRLWQTVIAHSPWNRFIQIISSTQGGVIYNSRILRMPSIVSLGFFELSSCELQVSTQVWSFSKKCVALCHSYVIIMIFKYFSELIWNSVIPSAA